MMNNENEKIRNTRKNIYRVTPHIATGIPPANLMFNRKNRHNIPNWSNNVSPVINDQLERNDFVSKQRSKFRSYNRQNVKVNDFMVGDQVLIKQPYTNKLSTRFNPRPYVITHKKHSMLTGTNPHTNDTKPHSNSNFVKLPITASIPRHTSIFNSKRSRRRRRL